MSLIAAAQITAVATAALALFAIVTAWYARKAFRGQSQEVGLLQEQLDDQRKVNEKQTGVLELQAQELRESLEERKRESEQGRMAQASRVFIWQEYLAADPRVSKTTAYMEALGGAEQQDTPVAVAHVKNSSDQPIYKLNFSWYLGSTPQGGYDRETPLMPGDEDTNIKPVPPGASRSAFGAAVLFRDAAGVRWLRRPDGELIEQTG